MTTIVADVQREALLCSQYQNLLSKWKMGIVIPYSVEELMDSHILTHSSEKPLTRLKSLSPQETHVVTSIFNSLQLLHVISDVHYFVEKTTI